MAIKLIAQESKSAGQFSQEWGTAWGLDETGQFYTAPGTGYAHWSFANDHPRQLFGEWSPVAPERVPGWVRKLAQKK